jgi:NADPH:quinone reductase-like Zn-dependent oxidoreductase
MMRAAVADRDGRPDVLRIVEVEKPNPAPDEVLVRIHAAAVTMSDIFIRSGRVTPLLFIPFRLMIGLIGPRARILGFAYAGVVEEIGGAITRLSPGDEVYGMTGFDLQAYAEYRCAKKGAIEPGDRVLIYGASGSSGTIAVQYAKHLGAHVTGVCGGRNTELVMSLGADEVIDYTQVDAPPRGAVYDFVMDSVGGLKGSPLKDACKQALAPGGRYVSIDDGDLLLEFARLDQIARWWNGERLGPFSATPFPLTGSPKRTGSSKAGISAVAWRSSSVHLIQSSQRLPRAARGSYDNHL